MQIDPGQLELEITERMAMANFDKSVQVLRQLREIGIKTSIGDFGTGYSSLSYIQELPIDTLKIDRAFVKNINGSGEHGEIAKAIITMAQSLGLHTIAEGVETQSQFEFLKGQGVDEIQGWYFGGAMSALDFERFVKRHQVASLG
jgi:EAL domain-containing protein (putative c-di-GMP-specific phosphodiesterase class I)